MCRLTGNLFAAHFNLTLQSLAMQLGWQLRVIPIHRKRLSLSTSRLGMLHLKEAPKDTRECLCPVLLPNHFVTMDICRGDKEATVISHREGDNSSAGEQKAKEES